MFDVLGIKNCRLIDGNTSHDIELMYMLCFITLQWASAVETQKSNSFRVSFRVCLEFMTLTNISGWGFLYHTRTKKNVYLIFLLARSLQDHSEMNKADTGDIYFNEYSSQSGYA